MGMRSSWEQVTSGDKAGGLSSLPNFEEQIAEGQRTKIDLTFSSDVLQEITDNVRDALLARRIPAEVTASGNTVSIVTRKGSPWLAVIAVALIGIIILAILLVAWKLWKEVVAVAPQPLLIIGITAIIVVIVVIATYVVQRRVGL